MRRHFRTIWHSPGLHVYASRRFHPRLTVRTYRDTGGNWTCVVRVAWAVVKWVPVRKFRYQRGRD